MFQDIKQYTEDELKKIRDEILVWIEKNEKKKFINTKNVAKSKPENIIQEKNSKTWKRNAFIALALVILLILGDIMGIYIFRIKSQTFAFINTIFPLPAVSIDSKNLSYSSYVYSLKGIERVLSIKTDEYIWYKKGDSLQNNLIRYEFLKFLQEKYAIPIQNDMVSQKAGILYNSLIQQNNILSTQRITQDDIKEYLVLPYLIFEGLREKYQDKSSEWSQGRVIAETIRTNIRNNNISFSYDEVLQNSNQSAVVMEKDLGFIERGVSQYNFHDSLFSASIGDASEIYEDSSGFHIFVVVDRFLEMNMIRVNEIGIIPKFDFEMKFHDDIKNIKVRNFMD